MKRVDRRDRRSEVSYSSDLFPAVRSWVLFSRLCRLLCLSSAWGVYWRGRIWSFSLVLVSGFEIPWLAEAEAGIHTDLLHLPSPTSHLPPPILPLAFGLPHPHIFLLPRLMLPRLALSCLLFHL
ncbi:uncharacterized protein BO72DRAFT_231361 [Aspergillus fijiensis CBS 313.89]|uniref:Uncharacterized protein n=1 Tax=Aspergillus fijiensis CBS 313.89 TaxID=1448319 RepID=A0A8G1VUY9_9EURO|nr:uncharacterized protein BO72DRAFT_231361 [Aspergillus fijiensis CBS 313.89]RAK73547.1 hypothetical protein BO72DRAFT_231361 [Aspergillus fijiensis CBS 313.89]